MSKGKRIVMLVLLIATGLSALAPASCPLIDNRSKIDNNLANMKYPDLPRYFHDPALGVTVSLPEGWSLVTRKENPYVIASAPDAGPNGPLSNLVIERLGNRMNPYDYLSANIITLQASIPGLSIVRWQVEVVNDQTMAWIQYTYPLDGDKVEAVAYCVTRDFKAYVITGVAPAKVFSLYEPTLRAIGRSLAID